MACVMQWIPSSNDKGGGGPMNNESIVQENDVVLDIKDLTVRYVQDEMTVEAVNNISIQLKSGKILGLVGETGAGKTSTALAALNLIQCPPGQVNAKSINVCGHEMQDMSQEELERIRGNEISMIFQDPMTSLNPVFTVGSQIAEAVMLHEKCSKAKAMERAEEVLELVGIPRERASEYPHQFSGGMKQRVVIAIALCCNPKVLIADEPTTALDVTIQAQVLDLMRNLRHKFDTAMIMITHDLGIVASLCDEVAVMYAGRIVEKGTLEDIFNHTKHPYTEGLFNALPDVEDRTAKLRPIPGLMPDPTRLPKGCAFAPRCQYATPECINTPQQEVMFSDTHMALCSRYHEPQFQIQREKK